MKMTWENIDNYRITKGRLNETLFRRTDGKCRQDSFVLIESCSVCKSPYFIKKQHINNDNTCSNQCRNIGKGNPGWRGGVTKRNLPLYDTYSSKFLNIELVRRNVNDTELLEVTCTYCGKWYIPTNSSVRSRINSINDICKGEQRFYCSEECKHNCPIYYQKEYPKDFIRLDVHAREVQPQLRKLVFKRDNWICTKCGYDNNLTCHHIDPVINNPIESCDIDNCVTLCKSCHRKIHMMPGCGINELRCNH